MISSECAIQHYGKIESWLSVRLAYLKEDSFRIAHETEIAVIVAYAMLHNNAIKWHKDDVFDSLFDDDLNLDDEDMDMVVGMGIHGRALSLLDFVLSVVDFIVSLFGYYR